MAKKVAKQSGSKSLRYPYYGLRQCLKLATIVKQQGGELAPVPKSVIATHMSTDQGGSVFAQVVASTKTFGLVDGTQDLQLTSLGRDYFFPTDEGGARSAQLQLLAEPPAFHYLVGKLDGSRLPSTAIIANMLGRECGTPESWRLRAAQIFISTAEELGVLSDGYLRYSAYKHSAQTTPGRAIAAVGGDPPRSSEPDVVVHDGNGPVHVIEAKHTSPTVQASAESNVWVYTHNGATVRLETPNNLTMALWDRLKRYIEVLKPDDLE